jgi:membrane protein DedA with SNARE-associated domain
MLESLTDVLSGSPLTYALVALLVAGDAIVPVFPGESAVVAAAVLAADGELMVWLILLAAFAGAFVGDLIMYGLGRWAGARLLRRFASEGSRAERVRWARDLLMRRGMALVAAAQFVPGGRNVIMLSAGALHYPLRRFLAAEAVGAALWAAFQTAIGYFGGRLFDDTLTSLLVSLGIAFAIGGLIELADRLMRSARARAASGSGG